MLSEAVDEKIIKNLIIIKKRINNYQKKHTLLYNIVTVTE